MSVLENVIDFFGEENQLRQVQEEAGELIVAINHYIRFQDSLHFEELIGEIADLEIMLAQLRIILDADDRIDAIKEDKITYLQAKLVSNHKQ